MNFSTFAPTEFKEHLKELKASLLFNKAREDRSLSNTNILRHYVLTGNEGVGKEAAADDIFALIREPLEIEEYAVRDANNMFESQVGFENSIREECGDNKFIYIRNAESLGMKGNIGGKNGLEMLCDKIPTMKNTIVVLTGKRNRLMELIMGSEKASQLFANIFHFEDMTAENMMQYMTDYANEHDYIFAPEAEEKLLTFLGETYKRRGARFQNATYLKKLFDKEIVPRMAQRVMRLEEGERQEKLCIIMAEDLPEMRVPDAKEAIRKLENLVGLENIKKQIVDHTALVKLNKMRAAKGIYNSMPPMHMVFTGNPGTGKTTIAKYVGEIYHSIGVLSSGHMVVTERSKMVGEYIGETEQKTLRIIDSAAGGVLFIDEAYSLVDDPNSKRDFGMRVIETLLTYLSAEETDMIIILAGYTNEMNKMLESNPGLKSRFPYIFHFEDYTPDQLMQIGKNVLKEENYTLTAEAERKMSRYIIHSYENKDEHFGNGRFVTRLVKSHIIPSMSKRLLEKDADTMTLEDMTTIEECDIPDAAKIGRQPQEIDDVILTEAMERLDKLVGLHNVKRALHDFVTVSRASHQQGILKVSPQNLCWDFTGKTGTGKSTVAEILGKVLHGLGILKRGHTICVNAEELLGSDTYQVLEKAIKKASDGLLFLDMDAPNVSNFNMQHLRMWIQNKIRENDETAALVVAQAEDSEDMIAHNLATHGIASYGNAIVFDDYKKTELYDILAYLLNNEYNIGIEPEAKTVIQKYIDNIKASDTKASPVNARTMQHLSQTIAHITQLRLAQSDGERMVTAQDVAHFKWDKNVRGKVGFA
ncbi:MAG: AAA family ATPase [Prevotella sp.]|nr:AAA family ATPase [Prevotella sp.]